MNRRPRQLAGAVRLADRLEERCMIIVLRPHVTEEELAQVVEHVRQLGLTPHVSRGVTRTIVGCIGDEDRLREVPMLAFPAVETVVPIEKPYKLAAREFAAGDTLVTLGHAAVGDGALHVIAGPCSVEGEDMLRATRSEEHTSELQSRPHLVCRL